MYQRLELLIGNKINVKLFKPQDKQKVFEGVLKAYGENELQLEVDGKIINIENANVALAKTVFVNLGKE